MGDKPQKNFFSVIPGMEKLIGVVGDGGKVPKDLEPDYVVGIHGSAGTRKTMLSLFWANQYLANGGFLRNEVVFYFTFEQNSRGIKRTISNANIGEHIEWKRWKSTKSFIIADLTELTKGKQDKELDIHAIKDTLEGYLEQVNEGITKESDRKKVGLVIIDSFGGMAPYLKQDGDNDLRGHYANLMTDLREGVAGQKFYSIMIIERSKKISEDLDYVGDMSWYLGHDPKGRDGEKFFMFFDKSRYFNIEGVRKVIFSLKFGKASNNEYHGNGFKIGSPFRDGDEVLTGDPEKSGYFERKGEGGMVALIKALTKLIPDLREPDLSDDDLPPPPD